MMCYAKLYASLSFFLLPLHTLPSTLPPLLLPNPQVFCSSVLCMDNLCARQVSKSLIKTMKVVTILVDESGVKKIR